MMGDVETSTTPGLNGGDVLSTSASASGSSAPSQRIVRTNVAGTVAFLVSASIAAIVFNGPARVIGVAIALALFAIGVFAFLWSYITAVNRSRTDNIAVAQLYFLVSGSAPKPIRRLMMSLLSTQVVVAFATAIARSRTDGRAGSTLAFGILVPMFGLGLNGLWCSRYGNFSPRQEPPRTTGELNSEGVPPSDDEMEQNSPHG